jgi:hypothetical protein
MSSSPTRPRDTNRRLLWLSSRLRIGYPNTIGGRCLGAQVTGA